MPIRRRRLPHLDVPGRPVFITFRVFGSLPANRRFPASTLISGQAFVAMDRLLDVATTGPQFLSRPDIAQTVLDAILRGAELDHYDLHAWVIMSNHVHLLLTPAVSLSKLLGSMKTASAIRANALLGRSGQPFWQDESFDHLVRNDDEFRSIMRYIETNPVTAGLVERAEQYRWSSAWAANVAAAARVAAPL